MTKAAYYEMCEALGTDPAESEIPVEYDDLALDVQQALGIYQKLRDEWDTMNGNYLGKSYAGIMDIFNILNVPAEDRRLMFDLIGTIDKHRSQILHDTKPKKPQ